MIKNNNKYFVTKCEYKKTHKDFKSCSNGIEKILIYENGTCLVPVEIVDNLTYCCYYVTNILKLQKPVKRDILFMIMDSEELQKDIIKHQKLRTNLCHDLTGLMSNDKYFVPRILKNYYLMD